MNRIKEVLHEKGIKQVWLAEKLGKAIIWGPGRDHHAGAVQNS
jgi:hypothetical protein